MDGVKNVYVSTSEQGENAMSDNLRDYGVDCAFVWPNWAETYSYVYYEVAICGVYVISNQIDSAISWFLKPSKVRQQIDSYRQNGNFRPAEYIVNDDLTPFIPPVQGITISKSGRIPRKAVLKSCLYRLKYRGFDLGRG